MLCSVHSVNTSYRQTGSCAGGRGPRLTRPSVAPTQRTENALHSPPPHPAAFLPRTRSASLVSRKVLPPPGPSHRNPDGRFSNPPRSEPRNIPPTVTAERSLGERERKWDAVSNVLCLQEQLSLPGPSQPHNPSDGRCPGLRPPPAHPADHA